MARWGVTWGCSVGEIWNGGGYGIGVHTGRGRFKLAGGRGLLCHIDENDPAEITVFVVSCAI